MTAALLHSFCCLCKNAADLHQIASVCKQVSYDDGDEEILNLKKQRWKFVDDSSVSCEVSYLDVLFCASFCRQSSLCSTKKDFNILLQEQAAETASPDAASGRYASFPL